MDTNPDIVRHWYPVRVTYSRELKVRDILPECIAIGAEGAYITGSVHPVDLTWDAGLYGWHGLASLCRKIESAYTGQNDLESLIRSYNLVV